MNLIQNLEAAWYYHLGSRHLEANDDRAALANFNRAVKLQSDHYKAWFGRGMALGNLERHLEALHSFDEALAVQPNASWLAQPGYCFRKVGSALGGSQQF